jgi:uncharacterized protein YndB with AHSA1/START domain
MAATKITVQVLVDAPLEKAWDYWTSPNHITRWNAASDDWHTPRATNDMRVGGSLSFRMEARDKSAGFDFGGTYTLVSPRERLHFVLGDGRHVDVRFLPEGNKVRVVEEFETETTNSAELQRKGWQAILDNFKKHVETT